MTVTRKIAVTVNGLRREAEVPVRLTLADLLRKKFELTGTHLGCEHGVCGACTVLFDGVSVRACLMLAVQADNHAIETVEGLAAADAPLNDLQQAFSDKHALQCGFCTPGILMTLTEFLRDNPVVSEEDIKIAISGNICRCTGYQPIVEAAMQVVKARQGNPS
ncbi:MAG: (2Fe-2S)-binding protein [Pseudolabrys sp.]|nr:(2Fe-2S)-binding protein [Pseudolabrys sp.]MDP2295414.1 (2Fe-2S)-binding protein [Pseudolabrys sp.]